MKRFFALLLLLYINCAAAETYATVEAYLVYATNGQSIGSKSVQSSAAGDKVFGAVQWNAPGADTSELACVFVLEKLKGGGFKEVVRSNPSGGFSGSAMQVFDGIEVQSNSRFSVRLHSFKPLGTITYRFALIDQSWHLSGRDEEFLHFYPENGDESVGDTREERSTNFLTGKIIEKRFQKNKLASTIYKKSKFPKFPLAEFQIFDERHGEL